jgi:hypothetical protein
MITKRIFAEQVLRLINGGDYPTSNPIDERDVYLYGEQCLNYLLEKHLNLYGDDISSEFISTYEAVPILRNTVRNKLYSELPSQLVSLKGGRGLRQISTSQDEENVFIPINSGDDGVYRGLEASNLGGQIGYWLEGSKVLYKNMPDYFEGKTVMIKMISSLSSIDEDERIMIPASVEKEFIDMVVAMMKGARFTPKDEIADNNDSVQ